MSSGPPPDIVDTAASDKDLDTDHLQKCARIWLEGLLKESLDPDKTLLEVLQDGEILLRVARGLKTAKASGPEAARASYAKKGANSRSSQKLSYLAYNNVEYFLNFCREVGLNDIHLFSPSDLVESKDVRRVCVCLRMLSSKVKDAVAVSFEDVESLQKMRRRPSTKVGDILETFQPRRPTEDAAVSEPPAKANGVSSRRDSLSGTSRLPDSDSSKANRSDDLGFPLWAPVAAGLLAVVGIFLARRAGKKKPAKTPLPLSEYEIQKGDTLIHISGRVGKAHWEDLVKLNPTIENPDLIYPKDKLKL
ncbi:Calponin homology domain containing protein [Klebsormidium nitens]|uniref:Calponin homology domain containing protein n=1 Tax=Klebsormidium nitens TaxID=105231 RepID=A0A1Y1IV89_KLENI|nr:Calponin homology domain containing protein [Klebsormidium nitens]|eukprot:GAQ92607.1 Calponin homology domain containing protein [Klebsormidium nitens]